MTRVALFGGSFDPPHAAHQLVVLYVLETQPVDEVWITPVYTHVFGKDLAPYADRVAMCERMMAPLGRRVRVCRNEEELANRPDFVGSRTLDLVQHLTAQHRDTSFRLLVGADILAETAKWYRWDDIVAMAPLIVVGRTGHRAPAGTTVTGVTMPQISSTTIRAELAALPPKLRGALVAGDVPTGAESLASLLPASVLRYIAERDLYRS